MKYRDADDADVVPDGYTLRVPTTLMDTARQPGFAPLSDEVRELRQATRDRYLKKLTTAWKKPTKAPALSRRAPPLASEDPIPRTVADGQARRAEAYDRYRERLARAWARRPLRDAVAARIERPHDDPAAAMAAHLNGAEPDDDDAEAVREHAYAEMQTRLNGAWKNNRGTRGVVGFGPAAPGASARSVGVGPNNGGR
jgi:hypothetical protein